MKKIKCQWKEHQRFFTRWDAQVVGEELERIREKVGDFTPADIVKAARKKASPLHPIVFDRDKDAAAESWWLQRAKKILSCIEVEYINEAPEQGPVRAYVSYREADTNKPHYTRTDLAMKDPAKRASVLELAVAELRSIKARYHMLKELHDVFRAIDNLKA